MKNTFLRSLGFLFARSTQCPRVAALAFAGAAILSASSPEAHAQAVASITRLHTFDRTTDGGFPIAGLFRGHDGNFYGTTYGDGATDAGTLFRLTPTGIVTILYRFDYQESNGPTTGVIQAGDGNFYGTTAYGGTIPNGTIYRVTPAGAASTLHVFDDATEGSNPKTSLVQGSDGNFYGSTSTGAANNDGAVFKFTPDGTLTVLHQFSNDDGGTATAALIQGNDGNLYGTTSGAIFRVTPTGGFTLFKFNNNVSGGPLTGLTLGGDGNFYGTGYNGGGRGCGTIFRFTPAGVFTALYNFYYADGYEINGPLALGSDGNFYGTTTSGGNHSRGTVFRVTPAGELTVLYSFSTSEPSSPTVGVNIDSDGSIYGLVPSNEGAANTGTFFKLTVSEIHPPFFVGEAALDNGIYYLTFSEPLFDKTYFGYYSYLSDPHYLYHFDLGYEYVFDANDGNRGVYLYDFASNTFFYTSPVFAFPYLYDFSLNTVLYYYPDPNNQQHYNTNGVRYFYNFASGQIITK